MRSFGLEPFVGVLLERLRRFGLDILISDKCRGLLAQPIILDLIDERCDRVVLQERIGRGIDDGVVFTLRLTVLERSVLFGLA